MGLVGCLAVAPRLELPFCGLAWNSVTILANLLLFLLFCSDSILLLFSGRFVVDGMWLAALWLTPAALYWYAQESLLSWQAL